ncbi:MAG: hypothetical protein CO149_00805 [Nitrospirae bacterium CG_4_9_14_3_um_filter_51_5]|nr:MAG: hypothetical protein CO149_00805 [Nitrospirae bacterium CG_4_9_14_3_um_filter_51_5]
MRQSKNFSRGVLKQVTGVFVLLAFSLVLGLGAPGVSLAAEQELSSPTNEAGLGIGSALLTVVYFPFKLAYAILGGVVGTFTYGLTGGDLETAKAVWEPSFYGTYVITPDHLKGNEPVRFIGISAYEEEALQAERP